MILLATLFSVFANAGEGGLPKRFDVQNVSLQSLPHTKQVWVKAHVAIPPGFKSSQFAMLDIYEKQKGGWKLAHQIKQKDQLSKLLMGSNDIKFEEGVILTSEDSEVAFDLSVSFCKKICVINNFQGVAKRNKKAKSNHLEFQVRGQLPTERMKKNKGKI